MRIAVATRAGMLLGRGMHAASEPRGFVSVACLAVNLGDVIGMRIFLDVGVAVVALQAAVMLVLNLSPSTEMLWPAASCMVLSPWQARQSACAATRRGNRNAARARKQNESARRCRTILKMVTGSHSADPTNTAIKNATIRAALVMRPSSSSMRSEQLRSRTWLPRSEILRSHKNLWRGLQHRGDSLWDSVGSDSGHKCNEVKQRELFS